MVSRAKGTAVRQTWFLSTAAGAFLTIACVVCNIAAGKPDPRDIAYDYFGALDSTGGRVAFKSASSVVVSTFRDTTTPFLSRELDGHPCWRVVLQDVVLRTPTTTEDYVQRRMFTFTLEIDTLTGLLLRATGVLQGLRDSLPPLPTAAEAETLLTPNELYEGPTPRPSAISLMVALRNNTFLGPPASAQKIIAYPVVYSTWRVKRRPAWVIQFSGMPPDDRHSDIVPEIYRRYWRHVVDMDAGEVLKSTNFPQHLPKE